MPGLKLTRKLPAWNGNVSAGNTLSQRIPIGLTTHQVWTEFAFADAGAVAVVLADAIGEIRMLLNGKVIWNCFASELDTLNQYKGRAAASGILCMDFDRFNLRTRLMEELTAIGTGQSDDPNPATTFIIEWDIKAGSGVASGSMDSRVVQSEAQQLGIIKKVRRYTDTFSVTGDVEISNYPLGDLINMAAFFESANDIDRLRIERDNYVLFDRTKELNSRIQTDGVRTPQANLFVYDTTEAGNGRDQLVTRYPNGDRVNDLRFTFTLDGAMTITGLLEYMGSLES